MTNDKLEAMARLRGITVEELRQQYSSMGKKSPRTGSIKSSERASELGKLGAEARRKKKEASESDPVA